MSQQQPEGPEITASFFGGWLLEASEAQLQEFIDGAPQWLSKQPLALLHEFKALVDARLAAEPKKKVIILSNPQDSRASCWHEIAGRLEAEINFRSGESAQVASVQPSKNPVRPGAQKDPAVAARRTHVRNNSELSDNELCELLDREAIRLPTGWPEAGHKTWAEAYRSRKRQIHVIFSKDRTSS